MFRVRFLAHAHEGALWDALQERGASGGDVVELVARERVRRAVARRKALNLPREDTDAYRLCNGEGDRLSGLVIDVIGPEHVVVSSSSLWCEVYKRSIQAAVRAEMGEAARLIWRKTTARLAQDGYNEVFDEVDREAEDAEEEDDEEVVIQELGFRYAANPASGQKTGFYCDQRENRATFASLLRPGAEVADLCCCSGGFGIHAVGAGAAKVTAVDSSQPALDLAARNAALNGPDYVEAIEFVKDDVAKWMHAAAERGETFDAIVLDPPKLAPSRAKRAFDRAKQKYRKLNKQALKLVRPGGILVTCTCSGAMTQSGEFLSLLRATAREAGRDISLAKVGGAAADHVLNPAYPEGEYLTAMFLVVD